MNGLAYFLRHPLDKCPCCTLRVDVIVQRVEQILLSDLVCT